MQDNQLWQLERKLWLDGVAVYENNMDASCVMAFPGMGVMRAADVLESLKEAPRWNDVEMTSKTIAHAGETTIVLGYRAEGRRRGSGPYRCLCTSTYRRDGARWLLVQHQQTPE